jgi:hypothetical protein
MFDLSLDRLTPNASTAERTIGEADADDLRVGSCETPCEQRPSAFAADLKDHLRLEIHYTVDKMLKLVHLL